MTDVTSGLGWGLTHLAMRVPLGTGMVCVAGYLLMNPADETPLVVFTFDDGYESLYWEAGPVMRNAGFVGTSYINTGAVGGEGYMTWEEHHILEQYEWELGAHTVTHPFLTQVDEAQQWVELMSPLKELPDAVSFASPYGDYDQSVIEKVSMAYETHVNAWSEFRGINTVANWDNMNIHRLTVRLDTDPEEVCQTVDDLQDKETFVLLFHKVVADTPVNPTEDEQWVYYSRADFETIVNCVAEAGLRVPTLTQAARLMEHWKGKE